MGGKVLGTRERNRALLDRQLLLERVHRAPDGVVEHLVGLQAQEPQDPYVALWSRIERFRPEELSGLLEGRRAVRGTLMRGTIHLVTARDFLAMWPMMRPLLERVFRTTPWGREVSEVNLDEVLEAGRGLLEAEPRTNAEVAAIMAERWPDGDGEALARAVRYLLPTVQVPPRGLWGRRGQATHTTVDHWVGRPLRSGTRPDGMILRYLAAFGPASVPDMRTWSGLPGLREVVERLRPRLRTFRDGRGRELFDVPDAPLPGPDTPAPVRFLPTYDNVLLAHDDRSLIVRDEDRRWLLDHVRGNVGTVLVDGFVRAIWRVTPRGGAATLGVQPIGRPLSKRHAAAVTREGESLLAFAAPDAGRHDVRLR